MNMIIMMILKRQQKWLNDIKTKKADTHALLKLNLKERSWVALILGGLRV